MFGCKMRGRLVFIIVSSHWSLQKGEKGGVWAETQREREEGDG